MNITEFAPSYSRSSMLAAWMIALASAASAGDAAVVYGLTVLDSTGPGFADPNIAALVTGDSATAHFEVELSSASPAGLGVSYSLDLSGCYLEVSAGHRISPSSGGPVDLADNVNGIDSLIAGMTLGGGEVVSAVILDFTGALSSSDDLSALIGTSLSIPLGTTLTIEDGATFMSLSVDSVMVTGGGGGTTLGTNYCTANPNATGATGAMSATGSSAAASNNVTLMASNLPNSQFGIFVVGQTAAFVPNAGGNSNGNLCVGGAVGRYNRPGQILSTGATGSFSLQINLSTIPQNNGNVATMPGDTWFFQAWHRSGLGLGSNLTDGLEISFN